MYDLTIILLTVLYDCVILHSTASSMLGIIPIVLGIIGNHSDSAKSCFGQSFAQFYKHFTAFQALRTE